MTITRAHHFKKYTFDNIEIGEKFGPVEGVALRLQNSRRHHRGTVREVSYGECPWTNE
jgi:hypothetical protein